MYKILDKGAWTAVVGGLLLICVGSFGFGNQWWKSWAIDPFNLGFLIFMAGLGLGWLATEGRSVAFYKKTLLVVGVCLFFLVLAAEYANIPGLGFLHNGQDASAIGLAVAIVGIVSLLAGVLLTKHGKP